MPVTTNPARSVALWLCCTQTRQSEKISETDL